MTKINADNLKYLTLRQKKAAILMLEGKSYVEISKILGCSKQNVSQLLKSAGNQVEIKSSSKQMFIPSLKKQEKITIKKQEEVRRKQESARRKRESARKRQEETQLYRKERYLGKLICFNPGREQSIFAVARRFYIPRNRRKITSFCRYRNIIKPSAKKIRRNLRRDSSTN